jgi:hypothetical protein
LSNINDNHPHIKFVLVDAVHEIVLVSLCEDMSEENQNIYADQLQTKSLKIHKYIAIMVNGKKLAIFTNL